MTARPLYVTICSECGTLTESPHLAGALCADCEAMQVEPCECGHADSCPSCGENWGQSECAECAQEAEKEHEAMQREYEASVLRMVR